MPKYTEPVEGGGTRDRFQPSVCEVVREGTGGIAVSPSQRAEYLASGFTDASVAPENYPGGGHAPENAYYWTLKNGGTLEEAETAALALIPE